jgi:hypothetical protein
VLSTCVNRVLRPSPNACVARALNAWLTDVVRCSESTSSSSISFSAFDRVLCYLLKLCTALFLSTLLKPEAFIGLHPRCFTRCPHTDTHTHAHTRTHTHTRTRTHTHTHTHAHAHTHTPPLPPLCTPHCDQLRALPRAVSLGGSPAISRRHGWQRWVVVGADEVPESLRWVANCVVALLAGSRLCSQQPYRSDEQPDGARWPCPQPSVRGDSRPRGLHADVGSVWF